MCTRLLRRLGTIAAIALPLAVAAPLPAADFALTPAADAFVTSAAPSSNYGDAGALAVCAAGLSKGEFQTLLRFDTGPAKTAFDGIFGPGNWLVQGLSLRLTATSPNNPIFNTPAAGSIAVDWLENDGWTEGTGRPSLPSSSGITHAALPSFLGGNDQVLGFFNFDGRTSGQVAFPLKLPTGPASDVLQSQPLTLRLYAADAAVSGVFNARSFGDVGSRPSLVITAVEVPEPAALSLMALVSVFICSRRRGS